MADRERPSFEQENNVTVQRCFFAYEFAKPYITGKTVVDVGCANGYGSVYMCDFATKVTGFDYSQKTIDENLKTYREKKNLFFKQSSIPPLNLEDASVEVVTAFQFIEHIERRKEFMQEVKRVLKPGGVFICTTPNAKKSIARNPFHVHEYTFEEMKNESSSVFENTELMGLNGNVAVNKYYDDNAKWAKKILRLDPLGLHKMLPSSWLVKPYNYLTTLMRKDLKDKNDSTLKISTADFNLQKENLDECWDIFLIAKK